jgi:hypothetical protein
VSQLFISPGAVPNSNPLDRSKVSSSVIVKFARKVWFGNKGNMVSKRVGRSGNLCKQSNVTCLDATQAQVEPEIRRREDVSVSRGADDCCCPLCTGFFSFYILVSGW